MFISEMRRLKQEDRFLQKAKEIHNSRVDYSNVHYISNIAPIIIICENMENLLNLLQNISHLNMLVGNVR